jgi:hypothetical protein
MSGNNTPINFIFKSFVAQWTFALPRQGGLIDAEKTGAIALPKRGWIANLSADQRD